ncbi:MAG TPA: L,D-transpeptidase [Gaiellales bacterium]|nr:L,D-transpeptidase [Gaiellales bacterium]
MRLSVELSRGLLRARAAPSAAAPVLRTFGPRTPEGVTRVFLVRKRVVGADCGAAWYQVDLPIRPNGVRGWVRAAGLRPYVVHWRLRIELGRRRLIAYEGGRERMRLTVAIGRSGTPTPTGSYYVFERLSLTDPRGPYGPGALGLSSFSPVLTGWTRGGPIAIHGTNEAGSVGQAVSNGCVRVRNEQMRKLLREVPAGTPVEIVA